MLKSFAVWLATHLLKGDLDVSDRTKLMGHVLKTINVLPLHAAIEQTADGIRINGEPLDIERARVLRDAALRALENQAFKLSYEQARFLAVKEGLATSLPPEGLLFYRAAIWNAEVIKDHLNLLAQKDQEIVLEGYQQG